MKINAQLLRDKKACRSQIDLFIFYFGEKDAPFTKENCIKYASVFDFHWAAQNLLNEKQISLYNEAMIPIDKAYDEAMAPIIKAYNEAIAPIIKAYDEAIAPILKAYDEAKAPIIKAYNEAMAINFYNLSME